jgi:hypothetical protein
VTGPLDGVSPLKPFIVASSTLALRLELRVRATETIFVSTVSKPSETVHLNTALIVAPVVTIPENVVVAELALSALIALDPLIRDHE